MKNLENVKKFYSQVEFEAEFDYSAVANKFKNHNVFARTPEFHDVELPFFGKISLTLVAIQYPDYPNKSLSHCKIAMDDGKFQYGSCVAFLAKPTPILLSAGFNPEEEYVEEFADLIDLTCNNGMHSNLFGHPMKNWKGEKKLPSEFCTSNLPKIIAGHRWRFYPKELHEYPFKDGTTVLVKCWETTKLSGYEQETIAEKAMGVFRELSENIYSQERGNAHTCGYVSANGIKWIIPAFGKNHVSL